MGKFWAEGASRPGSALAPEETGKPMKTASENSKFRTAQRTVMVRSAVSRCSGQMGRGQVFSRCGTLQIRLGRPCEESCELYEPVWPELSKKVRSHRTHPRAHYRLLKLQLFLVGDYLESDVHTNSISNTWKLGTCSCSGLAVFDVPAICVFVSPPPGSNVT